MASFAVLWIRNDFFRIQSRIRIRLFREFRIRSRIRIRILLRILYEFVVTTFPLSLYFSLPHLSLIKSLSSLHCIVHCTASYIFSHKYKYLQGKPCITFVSHTVIYLFIHMYTHTHTYTHTHKHKHTYIYTRTYTLLLICNYYINYIYQDKPCITSHTVIYICVCVYTVYVCMCVDICVCVYVYVYVYVCMCTDSICMHLHIYTHTYICAKYSDFLCIWLRKCDFLTEKLGIKFIPDPDWPDLDPKWFIPDPNPDPDPAKSSGSDRIRIRIHNTALLRAEGFFCNLDVLYGGLGIGKLCFWSIKKLIFFFQLQFFLNFWSLKPWIRIISGSGSVLDPDPDRYSA